MSCIRFRIFMETGSWWQNGNNKSFNILNMTTAFILTAVVIIHSVCDVLPVTEAGVLDLDPVEPAGEGTVRRAATDGCGTPCDVGVGVVR